MAAVHTENLADCGYVRGCDWIVTGSAVFHSRDPEGTVRENARNCGRRHRDQVAET